jgi:hypothetical protein
MRSHYRIGTLSKTLGGLGRGLLCVISHEHDPGIPTSMIHPAAGILTSMIHPLEATPNTPSAH